MRTSSNVTAYPKLDSNRTQIAKGNFKYIDLGKENFAKGQVYVAIGRMKSLDSLTIRDLVISNKVLSKLYDEKALAEIQRLRRFLIQRNS
jgi:hypothetical protein